MYLIATQCYKLVVLFSSSEVSLVSTTLLSCFEVSLLRYLVSTGSLFLAVDFFLLCLLFFPVSSGSRYFKMHKNRHQGLKPMTLVISKLLLFIFLVIFSLRPRGTDVMSDFASSKKNFIRVVLIWNSCCLNSLGFIYCLSSSSWQLHWPLTFSSKF